MASTNIQTFPGKVGVSNTNPIHTLDIGSNVYIEDTADTKFRVYGNIHASGITVDGSITVIETDNLSVKDPVLLLAAGSTGTSDTGIIMKRSDGDSNVAIFYDEGVGLKLGHTMSSGDDIHLSVDTANALATSVYGPVNVVNSGTQALSVDGGAQVDGNFQVGVVSNLFVDTATSNVGIGTTSPAYKLEVDGKVGIQDELKVAYDADTASYIGRAAVGYMGQSDQASFSHVDKNTSANFALKQAASGATHLNTPTGQHIRFSVNASEVGRFTGGGDFEVGTSASTKKLIVDTSASEVQMYSQATGSTAGPDLVLMRNNPNNGANNEYIGQIRYEGLNDNGNSLLYAKTTGKIKTATNGSEDGVIETMIKTGGSNRISVRHSGAKFLIQKGTDLQVGEVANLYVDTATSRVGVNTSSPAYTLDVHGTANVGTLYSTLTYSNTSANIVAWNSSTNEIIDSGLEKGFMEHPVVPIIFDEETYDSSNPVENVGRIWSQYAEGHGTYEITASTYYVNNGQQIRPPWRLFNYQPTDGSYWQQTYGIDGYGVLYNASSPYEYTGSTRDPIMTTTDVGGTRYLGHWVQIKVPNSVTLAHADIYRTPESQFSGASNRAPGAGVFLGSNDGVAWYKLTEFSGASYASDDKERIAVNATTPYQYYRFVITNIVGGNSATVVNFNEWRLFAEKPVTRMENVHISGQLSSETLQTGYIKWPRKSLKANESEGYVASASNVYNTSVTTAPYTAFNNYREVKSNGYADAFVGGNGDFTAGVANKSRTTGGDTFNHEWLQIQMPRAIKLSHFTLLQRVKNVDNDNDMPKNGRMYGSNDGVSWTKLVTFSNLTYERYEETRVDVKSTTPYSYYRLAVTETVGSSQVYVAVGELQLFEAATGVGAAPTSAKLQVAGSLGMAKGSEFFAGDDVVMELPKHDRPLVKYPEVAMTANSSGGYVASTSSAPNPSYDAHDAFNIVTTSGNGSWHSGPYYQKSTEATPPLAERTPTSSLSSWTANRGSTTGELTTHNGEWLKIQLPHKIKLKSIILKQRDSYPTQKVRLFSIVGSNDDENWFLVHQELSRGGTSTSIPEPDPHVMTGSYVSEAFKYFAIVIYAGSTDNPYDHVAIGEWELYGTEEGDTSVDVVHRSVPNKPGQQHLEVYWDANDSNSYSFADSSSVYDLSGSGVKGTITGNNGFDAEYNAWVFDGSGDYISGTLSNPAGAWVHSTSFWYRQDSVVTANWDYIYQIGSQVAGGASLFAFKSDGYLAMSNYATSSVRRAFVPTLGQWYHISVVYSGGGVNVDNVSIYLDGKNIKLFNEGNASSAVNLAANTTLRVGSNTGGLDTAHGSISNLRLYSKALNADQVRELYEYDAPRFGHRQNLVSLHKGNLGVGVAHPTSRFEIAGADGLQEYPPRAMTDFETYMEGYGVFRVSASTYVNNSYKPYFAFDKNLSSAWLNKNNSNNSRYTGTDYLYSGINGLGDYAGEWLGLTLPYKISLKSVVIHPRQVSGSYTEMPEDGVILGYDSETGGYDTLDSWAGVVLGEYVPNVRTIQTHKMYSQFFLLGMRTVQHSDNLRIGELKFFGTPAPSALEDGHLTLGKALTLPRVSGHPAGAETPRAESLVVHYDTTVDSVVSGTTVVDTSGNGINPVMQNGLVYSSSERALVFDGTDDRTYISSVNNGSGAWVHSISLWCKSNSAANDSTDTFVFIGEKSSYKCIGLETQLNGNIRYYFWGSDGDTPTGSFTRGVWHHVAMTYDGGSSTTSKSVYIDGVKQTLTQSGGTTALNLNANDEFLLGCQQGGTKPLDGSISNFKLWDVALTAEEVAMEYALGRTGKSLNLTDTALCLGGTVPRAQLDVRGSALIEGNVGIGTGIPRSALDINNTGAMIIPTGTTAQQPGTGYTGMLRFNTSLGKIQVYNGTEWLTVGGMSATGGTVTNVDGYKIHTFTTSGTFTVISGGEMEYLIIGGGGGAPGRDVGGGGGAGGMLTGTYALPAGSYTITVGPGGLGKYDSVANVSGMKGSDSSIGSLFTATGGGAGKPHHKALPTGDDNGGSGGGGAGLYDLTGGTGISGQGNNGGNGAGTSVTEYGGGGGGGAGQAGSSAASGRHGGDGIQSSISGTATYYAGGGGGAGHRASGNRTEGDGGLGGGGPCNQSTTTSTRNGTDGLGGGGGASRNTGLTGGSGGDGIVIIRYLS